MVPGVEDDGFGLGRQDYTTLPSLVRTGIIAPEELGIMALVILNIFVQACFRIKELRSFVFLSLERSQRLCRRAEQ
jgi:hypothetical protein